MPCVFFEKVFSRDDVAQDFLQNYLSETIVNRLDLSTLKTNRLSAMN
jgi:hypothetical protein